MDSFTCKVDKQGRVLIPAKLRQEAGIEPESEVLVFVENGGLVVLTRERAFSQARALARQALGEKPPSLVDELIRTRREEARREEGDYHRHEKKSA